MAIHIGLERITLTSYVEAAEVASAPTRVRPDTLRFYVKDDGSGNSVFCYKDSAGNEFCTNGTLGFSGPHALLDGDVITDSVAQAVSRGSLIYGNSTPKWDELLIGANTRILGSDGTDVAWKAQSFIDHGSISGLSDDDHTQYVLRSILTTNGDIFVRLAGAVTRLGIGSDNQVLTIDAGTHLPVWEDPASGGTVDAGDVTYTPADNADWGGSDPGDVNDALDYLAANAGGGGGGGSVELIFMLMGA